MLDNVGIKVTRLLSRRQTLVVIIVFLIVISVTYFAYSLTQLSDRQTPSRWAWAIFTGSIVTLIAVGFLSTPTPIKPATELTPATRTLLAGIVLLAFALRVFLLNELPFGVWHDEAVTGLGARALWQDANLQPLFRDNVTYYHLWLHELALLVFGESSVVGLRLPSVLFGVGAVYVGFLVGRDLLDEAFGLGMAFFLAVPFWLINFSRIGMTGIDAVFISLLTIFYLLRTIKYGSWRHVFFLGLTIGFGLWLYAAFRFVCVALFIAALTQVRVYKLYWISRGLVIVSVVALLTIPIVAFAVTQPDEYFRRTRQISILEDANREDDSVREVFTRNLETYARMFHIRGDSNPRHNIPNQPMLDPIMGILVIPGLILSIFRRQSILFYLVLFAALFAGALTISSEAPNSLRSIVAIIPVAYFCTISLNMLRYIPVYWLRVGIIVLICSLVGTLNIMKYFQTFAHNPDDFFGFTTIETVRGREIHSYQAAGYDVKLPYRQSSSAILEFVAPDYRNKNDISFDELHPFPIQADTPVVLLLDPNENNWIWQAAQELYPDAEFRTITPIDYGITDSTELLNIIEIQPATGTEAFGMVSEIGLLIMDYGAYQFDGSRGIISVNNQAIDTTAGAILLPVGYHQIRTDLSPDELYWKLPNQTQWEQIPRTNLLPNASLAAQGLHASFYKDNRLILERIVPTLFAFFHEIPAQRPYEVIWSASLQAPTTGEYEFSIEATGFVEIRINDEILLGGQNINTTQSIYLEGNQRYALRINFLDNHDNSHIFLQWRLPETVYFQPIPPWNLTPGDQDN